MQTANREVRVPAYKNIIYEEKMGQDIMLWISRTEHLKENKVIEIEIWSQKRTVKILA